MRSFNVGVWLLITGIGLAVGFDSIAVVSIGCFISGVGLGLINRSLDQ